MKVKVMKFFNGKFKTRGLWQDEQAWLYAKDVCKCLKLGDVYQAVSRLEADERRNLDSNPTGNEAAPGIRRWLVNESGFYRLFYTSRLEPPEDFRRWVGLKVFPALRKDEARQIQKCVYALLMINGLVKIGHTKNFRRRLRQIETASGLRVVKSFHTEYFPCAAARLLEKVCHEYFASSRMLGEFFNVSFETAQTKLQQLAAWAMLDDVNNLFKE